MFRHSSSAPSYGDASYMQAALATVPTQIPRSTGVGGYCFDGGNAVNGAAFPPFATSPPSTYSSSSAAYYNNIHRSISAHSLPLHIQLGDNLNGGGAFFSSSSPSPHQLSLPPMSSSPSSSCGDLYDFTSSSCSVRRVFSTGDLQGMNVNGSSPVPSGDSCGQDAAGGGPFSQKVGRYSAEERKERVERYRLKRHQRNFTKKITYACRKSLADSRPRVKGRFARNGEAEAEADDREASDNSYDYYGYSDPSANQSTGNSRYHGQQHAKDDGSVSADAAAAAFVAGAGDNGDWWWRAPGAEGPRQVGFDVDEELWATLGDMLSVNLAS